MKTKHTIKQRREKVSDHYFALGYGRSKNKRNVYLIDGFYYAYHPEYSDTYYNPIQGEEFKGYVRVNIEPTYKSFHAVSDTGNSDDHIKATS